jgi:hypothetical protein
MAHRSYQITNDSILSMSFGERLALKMITTVLWPLATDERIGLLLTKLAANVADVAETDEEVDIFVERLRFAFTSSWKGIARRAPEVRDASHLVRSL